LARLEQENPEKLTYYVDETGIDKFVFRQNVRAKRGAKVYSKIRGKKFERLSIVAGKSDDHMAAPMVCKGTANSELFEGWFESFCEEIGGNIAVMDNASIHRKAKLLELAKKYDVTLVFQPPYSPDLNKIEKFWAWLKQKLRSVLKNFDNLLDAIFLLLFNLNYYSSCTFLDKKLSKSHQTIALTGMLNRFLRLAIAQKTIKKVRIALYSESDNEKILNIISTMGFNSECILKNETTRGDMEFLYLSVG
jgi:transposase